MRSGEKPTFGQNHRFLTCEASFATTSKSIDYDARIFYFLPEENHENHVLSKQLVGEAIRHDCGIIRMEQLKDIRDRTKTWNKHLNRMVAGWSFYQWIFLRCLKRLAWGILFAQSRKIDVQRSKKFFTLQ